MPFPPNENSQYSVKGAGSAGANAGDSARRLRRRARPRLAATSRALRIEDATEAGVVRCRPPAPVLNQSSAAPAAAGHAETQRVASALAAAPLRTHVPVAQPRRSFRFNV